VAGQLVKVWAVSYQSGKLHKVVLEYLSGEKQLVDAGKWDKLRLDVYFYHTVNRGNSKDLHH
jgi:hypothetical protein